MCVLLGMSRSAYYKEKTVKKIDTTAENAVIKIFSDNRCVYGTRKIKKELNKSGVRLSRRKIGKIMKKYHLISKYTLKNKPKTKKETVNEDKIDNLVGRQFQNRTVLEVVVSDLTYVKVAGKWAYICFLFDISCRRIVAFGVSFNKDAELVRKTFYSADCDLRLIGIFHTDRGSEFKNKFIDEIINAFGIKRSLSAKGTPIDNAVAEAMYKVLKTEFIFGESFDSLQHLQLQLFHYVHWYNNVRIHASLYYLTPNQAMFNLSVHS